MSIVHGLSTQLGLPVVVGPWKSVSIQVSGDVPMLPWVRFRIWVGIGLGLGLREGWVDPGVIRKSLGDL